MLIMKAKNAVQTRAASIEGGEGSELQKEKNTSRAGYKVFFGGFKFDDIDTAALHNSAWTEERYLKSYLSPLPRGF